VADQQQLDTRNAAFWSELCGSRLARRLGVVDHGPESLRRFDEGYFAMYPYLRGYVDAHDVRGRNVLEIGLGYGTLGQYVVERGAIYHGVDIAPAPVEMMRHRLDVLGLGAAAERVLVASAHALPFADGTFDFVFSIGCFHHTGHVGRAVDEVHRVLKSGGTAVVMLYNRHSLRLLAARLRTHRGRDDLRAVYDSNAAGDAAPHTEFTSRRDARRLFRRFSSVRVRAENFDDLHLRGVGVVARGRLLSGPLPRLLGLDLYVTARK